MMNLNYLALVVLLILGGVAAIPVYTHQSTPVVLPERPNYPAYSEALHQQLPQQIQQQAAGLTGVLNPVMRVTGADESLPLLRHDLNLALASHAGWRLHAAPEIKRQMMARMNEVMTKWGAFGAAQGGENSIGARMQEHFGIDMATQWSALATWQRGADPEQVVVTLVVNRDNGLQEFALTLELLHPAAELKWQQAFDVAQQAQNDAARWAKVGQWVMAVAGSLVLLLLLLWLPVRHQLRRRALTADIRRLPALIEDGHYVAALGMVERHLQDFPQHVDLIATRQRILDLTHSDPESAQRAFVEAKQRLIELRARMGNSAWLTPEERQNLPALLPYNPDLGDCYHQLLAQESEAKALESQQQKEALSAILAQGNTPQTIDALQALAVQQPQMQALKAIGSLQTPLGSGPYQLTLGTSTCMIHLGQRLQCGRATPDEQPDIALNDTRISRRHAALSWEGDQIWAEDLGSTRGLFVNGEPITSQPLNSGDRLDLGGAMQYQVTRQQGEEGRALWLVAEDQRHLLLQQQVSFSVEHGAIQPVSGPWSLLFYQQRLSLSDGETLLSLELGVPQQIGTYTVQLQESRQ